MWTHTLYPHKNCILSSRNRMCWQLTLPSFRTPSTQPGKDGSQLPWSLKSSRAFLPTAQSWEHRLCTLRYVADLNLTDYHASFIRAGQELFRKVTLGYFYQKLMISETRQLSKTQCTYWFSLEGFLGPKYFWAERTLSPKRFFIQQSWNNSNCVSGLDCLHCSWQMLLALL